MNGEVVFLFVYNVGTELNRSKISGILKNAEDFSSYEHDKAIPEEIAAFNIPAIFNLKEASLKAGDVTYKVKTQVAIYEIGSFSIRIRVPFLDADVSLLSTLTFEQTVTDAIKKITDDVRQKTEKAISKITPITEKPLMETYRFYSIDGDPTNFVKPNRRLIAGLLLGERHYMNLSDAYVQSTLHRSLSYYKDDIIMVDWDGSFMMDRYKSYEHELLVAEIANVQLLALRIYQSEVTNKIGAANDKFVNINKRGLFRAFRSQGDLENLSMELGHFYDETRDTINSISNIIFGFGDWYLARLYSMLSDSFRLQDWYVSLTEDLNIVEKIREFIQDKVQEGTSSALEWIVIALIVVEALIDGVILLKLF